MHYTRKNSPSSLELWASQMVNTRTTHLLYTKISSMTSILQMLEAVAARDKYIADV